MKLTHGLAAAALSLAALSAQAEVTGNVAVVSDYNWRGITQTSQDPALQAGIDYAHASGFYVGAWGSNVDFGNCCDENVEVDLYTGFRGGETVTWDVGLIYYFYPGADDLDFPEIYVGLGWEWLSGKISYSNDFGNYDESAFYYEANAAYELPANFGINAHLGFSDGDGIEAAMDGFELLCGDQPGFAQGGGVGLGPGDVMEGQAPVKRNRFTVGTQPRRGVFAESSVPHIKPPRQKFPARSCGKRP
jgi:uncharacterized protein (TIGR02001 family)